MLLPTTGQLTDATATASAGVLSSATICVTAVWTETLPHHHNLIVSTQTLHFFCFLPALALMSMRLRSVVTLGQGYKHHIINTVLTLLAVFSLLVASEGKLTNTLITISSITADR